MRLPRVPSAPVYMLCIAGCSANPPTPPPSTTFPGPNPGEQVTCYELTSHGQSAPNDTSPYMIPPGESYRCFYFDAPWSTETVITEFRSKLDNTRALHHW